MKYLYILIIGCLSVFQTTAQNTWVTKRIAPGIELQFSKEPQEMDYGTTHNWMVFDDSTLFQFSKIIGEDNTQSSFRNCRLILNGIVDQCKGKLLETDSTSTNDYCLIYFTVKPTASPLENFLIKGFTLDMAGKSYMLMTTTEKKNLTTVNRFIHSFKIMR